MPRLSQHFLSDPRLLDRIVDALDPRPDDVVLEIGAGTGTLTRRLAARVGWVVTVEKDARLADVLMARPANLEREDGGPATAPALPHNVTVIHGDALDLDWRRLPGGGAATRVSCPSKIAGNVPYAITTPLIDKALSPPLPERVVFLVQKEVADRVAAGPGSKTYGALSVGVQSLARVERLFTVRAGAFHPPPQVDSAVIRLTPLAVPLVPPSRQAAFRQFVTTVFGQRRKQLQRILRSVAGLERETAGRVLAESGIEVTARPETLAPDALARLYRAVMPS